MPEDKEKVEDFISLWRDKMKSDSTKPSVIGETLNRVKEVEKENEELRDKIKENINLFSKTEEIVKKTIEENERLREEVKKSSLAGGSKFDALQQENTELSNNVKNLTIRLTEKDNVISLKDNEIAGLKSRLNDATSALELMEETKAESNSEVSKALVEDLQSELSKKRSQIGELEQNIAELNQEIAQLNEQLIGKETASHVDYVLPVDTSKSSVIKHQPVQTSSKTLEALCQDLQSDLNKYKRVIDKLTQEKSELNQAVKKGGFELEPEEMKELKKENEDLRTEISQLHEKLKEKPKEIHKATPETLSLIESTRLAEDLKEKIKEKD